jgi:hypothetical protein
MNDSPHERYAAIVEMLQREEGVTFGAEGKNGFGSSELKVGGKIFAMLSKDRLVVKLPRQRVDALTATGVGERFDPRRDGRLMKEWMTIPVTHDDQWLPLAREALRFVAPQR